MDGSNGGTTFTDSSLYPKTVTANGNATTSTAVVKYGTASASFDGNGDYLTIPANTDFVLGDGNFTIEFWQYYNNLANYQTIISNGYIISTGGYIIQTGLGNGRIIFYYKPSPGGVSVVIAAESGTISTNIWYHVAIVKNGSTTTIYRNGISVASGFDNYNYISNDTLIIGGGSDTGLNNYWFNGYIDDLRITKGVARYTANFQPPTGPFPNR